MKPASSQPHLSAGAGSQSTLQVEADNQSVPQEIGPTTVVYRQVVFTLSQAVQAGGVLFLAGALFAALVFWQAMPGGHPTDLPSIVLQPPPTPLPTATASPTGTPAPIVVFVSGEVQSPGLYVLPPDARAGDALAAAGGLTASAAGAVVNQAEKLWDGSQVHVPAVRAAEQMNGPSAGVSGSLSAVTPVSASATSRGTLVDLNSASLADLTTLPGIGEVRAAAIIEGRPYTSVDDLVRVSGIGEKSVESLRSLVTVGLVGARQE